MEAFVFDTETTGLVNNATIKLDQQPEVIEFYGCLYDLKKKKLKAEFDTLIKPKKPVDEKITQITGITNDMLKGAPAFKDVADKIAKHIEGAPLAIAHNLSFDMEMLGFEFKRLERKLKWPPVLCTVEQTVHLKGFRLSMSNLHEYLFGETFTGAHRAKVDVHALVRCAVELHKRKVI